MKYFIKLVMMMNLLIHSGLSLAQRATWDDSSVLEYGSGSGSNFRFWLALIIVFGYGYGISKVFEDNLRRLNGFFLAVLWFGGVSLGLVISAMFPRAVIWTGLGLPIILYFALSTLGKEKVKSKSDKDVPLVTPKDPPKKQKGSTISQSTPRRISSSTSDPYSEYGSLRSESPTRAEPSLPSSIANQSLLELVGLKYPPPSDGSICFFHHLGCSVKPTMEYRGFWFCERHKKRIKEIVFNRVREGNGSRIDATSPSAINPAPSDDGSIERYICFFHNQGCEILPTIKYRGFWVCSKHHDQMKATLKKQPEADQLWKVKGSSLERNGIEIPFEALNHVGGPTRGFTVRDPRQPNKVWISEHEIDHEWDSLVILVLKCGTY